MGDPNLHLSPQLGNPEVYFNHSYLIILGVVGVGSCPLSGLSVLKEDCSRLMNIHCYVKPQTAVLPLRVIRCSLNCWNLTVSKQMDHKQILSISAQVFSPDHVAILVTKPSAPERKSCHFFAGRLAGNYLQGAPHSLTRAS